MDYSVYFLWRLINGENIAMSWEYNGKEMVFCNFSTDYYIQYLILSCCIQSFPPKNQNPYRMAACLRNFCYLLVVILNTLMISLYNRGSFFYISGLKYNLVVDLPCDLPTSKVFISIEVYYWPELCHGYKTLITIQWCLAHQ